MSSNKEPHYFCRNEYYSNGVNAHNRLFTSQPSVEIYGESSTGYMIWPEAINKISNNLSEPKIIMVLRHPVSRTISHWKWRVQLGLEERSLLQAVKENGYGYNPEIPDRYGYMAYLQFSNYSKYCPLWIQEFGKNNCLIITQENLRNDFHSVISECFSFLGLQSHSLLSVISANTTNELVTRPKPYMTMAMSVIPSVAKRNNLYRKVRDATLRALTPNLPSETSAREFDFLQGVLADDIEYFHQILN